MADSEVLWCHCAGVHSCNSPPGLWGAAVLHLGVRPSRTNEPGGGKRPAAPQNQPDCLYSALPAQVDQPGAEGFSISVSNCYLESLSSSYGSQKIPISYFFSLPPLSCSWFQEIWTLFHLPVIDVLPPTTPDLTFNQDAAPPETWRHMVSPLLYVFGAAVAYWGSALLRVAIRLFSLTLAPLHR